MGKFDCLKISLGWAFLGFSLALGAYSSYTPRYDDGLIYRNDRTVRYSCPDSVGQSQCPLANEPLGFEWRYIEGIGWRKFTPFGAERKDWWDYKKSYYRYRIPFVPFN